MANPFNVLTTLAGDNEIVPASPDHRIRVRQINIQNRHATTETDIQIKSGGNVIFGPIALPAKSLISVELASEEKEHIIETSIGASLVVNSSQAVPLINFGWKEVF